MNSLLTQNLWSTGIQIREVPLADVRVAHNSPIAPRIDNTPSPNPGMPPESQVGDIPVAESAALLNLPINQESEEHTSSFNNIPSANFIRDAPTSVEKLDIDGDNANIESAPPLVVQDPTEGAESGGSNADAEVSVSLKPNQGDEPPSSGQGLSKDIIEDTLAPTPVEGDGVNTDVGPTTSSKQGQGSRNIPSMVLRLRAEVISSIKSLNYDNYQSVINKVKESNSLLEPFNVGLTNLEPFIERIARCAIYAKEASEDPSVQAYIHNQQAQACVHEKALALERLSKSREGWANDINMNKEELQRLAERHQKLQAELCEIQDTMKILNEKIATSTSFFEASEPTQTDLQAELDKAKAQVIEDQGDYSDASLMAIFTKWLDELEEAKESLVKHAGH
ncbi:hypothetical protein J5N97_020384 [Dioscorea zingiberensis]|uniref:Uncharacterized protein n=1 Tax=Dioscorea zingiberensis TaxID=325984 RepID=A0A9D5CGE3_9LILI|nr:hypothetical protein J5N97_020384 [Dioscorea zingiberensis]